MGFFADLFRPKSSTALVKAPSGDTSHGAGVSNRTGGGLFYDWGTGTRPRSDFEWEKLFGDNARLRNPIHAIAVDVAKVRKRVCKKTISAKGENFEQLYGHAFEQLLTYPHPRLPWSKFAYVITGFLRLVGQAPIRVTFDERGPMAGAPTRLTPFAPHQIVSPPNRNKDYWDINWWGTMMQIPTTEILHLYSPDLCDPFQALGMARALADEVNVDEAMQKFQNFYFRNMAFLGAIVNAPGCDPEEMAKEWAREREGVLNSFKTLFMNAPDMKIENLSPDMQDLAFPEGLRLNRDLMGQGFLVPPERMGILENANRSTIDAADFFQQSGNVEPDVIYLEQAFNYFLAPLYNEPGLCVKFDNPVKETAEARLKQATAGTSPGCWLTVNEARELHERQPLPGGNVLAVPANNVVFVPADGELKLPTQGDQQAQAQAKVLRALIAELATNPDTKEVWDNVRVAGCDASSRLLTALLGASKSKEA